MGFRTEIIKAEHPCPALFDKTIFSIYGIFPFEIFEMAGLVHYRNDQVFVPGHCHVFPVAERTVKRGR